MATRDKVAFSNTIRLISLDPVPITTLTRQLLVGVEGSVGSRIWKPQTRSMIACTE